MADDLKNILESANLAHLLNKFLDENITVNDLVSLDDAALVTLGIPRLGDRIRFRDAYRKQQQIPLQPPPLPTNAPAQQQASGMESSQVCSVCYSE